MDDQERLEHLKTVFESAVQDVSDLKADCDDIQLKIDKADLRRTVASREYFAFKAALERQTGVKS